MSFVRCYGQPRLRLIAGTTPTPLATRLTTAASAATELGLVGPAARLALDSLNVCEPTVNAGRSQQRKPLIGYEVLRQPGRKLRQLAPLDNQQQLCCKIEALLGVEANAREPSSLIPTPNGVVSRKGDSSTGVRLDGFFVFHTCFRTPHVSSGPAWAARKKTPVPVHPGDTDQPVSEGLDKTQGQVVRQTLHRVNRCLMGTLDTLLDSLSGEGIARAITLGEPLPKREIR